MDVREKLVELPIEDALLVLREEHRQRTDSYTTYLAHGGKGDPAEEVGLDALAMAIYALEKTKWISVKDRLPDICGFPCLLCGENAFGQIRVFAGFTGYMERGKFKWHSNQKDIDIDVWTITHWMPLPHPPKEEARAITSVLRRK